MALIDITREVPLIRCKSFAILESILSNLWDIMGSDVFDL